MLHGLRRPCANARLKQSRTRHVSRAVVSIGLAGAALTACSPSPGSMPSAEYVALGSSFAAGPGVATRAEGSPFLCARSSANYPHLVAAALRIGFRDATCSGATIDDVLVTKRLWRDPQITAVGEATRLVTITIGGNDVGYLGNLAGESCANDRSRVPWIWRSVACSIMPHDRVIASLGALSGRLVTVVKTIRRRAPNARVVLVDYVTVLPAAGACPARAPLSRGQVALGNDVARKLADATAYAARATGAILVRASAATAGHDVCAADPWVFGFVFPGSPFSWGPFAYHPDSRGMRAVADAVIAAVRAAKA